jgi:hypothetical protein
VLRKVRGDEGSGNVPNRVHSSDLRRREISRDISNTSSLSDLSGSKFQLMSLAGEGRLRSDLQKLIGQTVAASMEQRFGKGSGNSANFVN